VKKNELGQKHNLLLYLISKSVHVIGRNRVTWRSIYLARQYCPH